MKFSYKPTASVPAAVMPAIIMLMVIMHMVIMPGMFLCACGKPSEKPDPTAPAEESTEIPGCVSDTVPVPSETPGLTPKPTAAPTEKPEFTPEPPPQSNVERILAGMTLEEKIGQLFFVLPESLCDSYSGKTDSLTEPMAAFLKKYPAGGIILSLNNISSPMQLKDFIDDMQHTSKLPLFIGMDEEGGGIVRIARTEGFDVEKFPDMFEIGKTGNPEKAYEVGFTIGGYLKEYGVNTDFAPVADVFTNPENTVIGPRSFGSDPRLAAAMVEAEIRGFHDRDIIACAKHFPGHGDTREDTHYGFVTVDKTWAELLECELIPFQSAVNAAVDMIMAAHIAAPNITGNQLPATLSYILITEKLRNEMGFDGVVITDAMKMRAITDLYSSAEAAVKAIQAGVDIILAPEDYEEAFLGLREAVNSGEINEARINESVLRILMLKEKYISAEGFDWAGYGK